jgi:hypothetical protein
MRRFSFSRPRLDPVLEGALPGWNMTPRQFRKFMAAVRAEQNASYNSRQARKSLSQKARLLKAAKEHVRAAGRDQRFREMIEDVYAG